MIRERTETITTKLQQRLVVAAVLDTSVAAPFVIWLETLRGFPVWVIVLVLALVYVFHAALVLAWTWLSERA
jgi:hypothetical protein